MNNNTWVKPNTDILRYAPPLPDGDEPVKEPVKEPVVKKKRLNKKTEYKSIIRTRAQKIREALAYHDAKLSEVSAFYKKFKHEPHMKSSDRNEVELATYIHNLRVAPLNAEFVSRVSEAIPWFNWSLEAPSPSILNCKNITFMILGTGAFSFAATSLQIYFSNPNNIRLTMNFASALYDKVTSQIGSRGLYSMAFYL